MVVHQTKERFQAQYGSLWNAANAYLSGKMPEAQAAAFENVVAPEFLGAVAQTRAIESLVAAFAVTK